MAENGPKKSVSIIGYMTCLLSDHSWQFRSFIWDTDTHLKTKEERKLLRKLDFSILTIGCLGFFVRFLESLIRMSVAEILYSWNTLTKAISQMPTLGTPREGMGNLDSLTISQWHARGSQDVWKSVYLCCRYNLSDWMHVLIWFIGYRLHGSICSHAGTFNLDYPEDPSELLACIDGNWLGYFHVRSSWTSQCYSALCFSIPRWILWKFVLSMPAIRIRIMVSIFVSDWMQSVLTSHRYTKTELGMLRSFTSSR